MTREEAKRHLVEQNYSCILRQNEEVIMTSREKGITPLWQYIQETKVLPTGILEVTDKVIGRAVAYLVVYLGISYVYTPRLSETAKEILEQYSVAYDYEECVPYILNRNKDGQCPMEEALGQVTTVEEAYEVIAEFRAKRAQMMKEASDE